MYKNEFLGEEGKSIGNDWSSLQVSWNIEKKSAGNVEIRKKERK